MTDTFRIGIVKNHSMKLWIAVAKTPYREICEGKVIEYYSTSRAREDLELLKKRCPPDEYDYFEIER